MCVMFRQGRSRVGAEMCRTAHPRSLCGVTPATVAHCTDDGPCPALCEYTLMRVLWACHNSRDGLCTDERACAESVG